MLVERKKTNIRYVHWLVCNKIFDSFGIIKGISKIKMYKNMQEKEFHNNTEYELLAFQKWGLWNSAEGWLNWALKSNYANHTTRLSWQTPFPQSWVSQKQVQKVAMRKLCNFGIFWNLNFDTFECWFSSHSLMFIRIVYLCVFSYLY